jgi:ribulose-5-phosphate 4-epimerase/fuculose-1-phosphate aldolase
MKRGLMEKLKTREPVEVTDAATTSIVEGLGEIGKSVPRTVEDERRHRKERLGGAFRLFARFGVNHGAAGHITARDPERPDRFWVNPAIENFRTMTVSDLLLVDDEGNVLEGDGPLNRAAFAIHSRIHRARPDVVAAAHAHSTYGQIWSTTGRLLDPLTQDMCVFYGDHAVFSDFTGVVLETEDGDKIARELGTAKAVILRNHGLLTVGGTVEEAAWWFLAMEHACQIQVMAESIGEPFQISPEMATITAAQTGTPLLGRLQFEYQWRSLVKEDDSFLR